MNLTSLGAAYKWNHTDLFFCDSLVSFSMKSSSFVCAVPCSEFLSFLRLSNIPEMGEPDGLLSMGSHRVGHE